MLQLAMTFRHSSLSGFTACYVLCSFGATYFVPSCFLLQPKDREKLESELMKAEDWLYDNMEATKASDSDTSRTSREIRRVRSCSIQVGVRSGGMVDQPFR